MLQSDVPLPHVQRIGSHNSHVTTTHTNCHFLWDCYYARANQHRGIDVQLLSGVRNLAIDAWSGPDPLWANACSNDSNDDGAPCFHHEGERFSTRVHDVMRHVGAWPTAPENQNEVLVIWVEDSIPTDASRAWFLEEFVSYLDKDSPRHVEAPGGRPELLVRHEHPRSLVGWLLRLPRWLFLPAARQWLGVEEAREHDFGHVEQRVDPLHRPVPASPTTTTATSTAPR
ncbi:hypothetical protein [Myxococcus stipitatus]|uniref:hypothetical protein n=1 Tax=Myxococcus stipitatus TaxID=83455 RepID=UPI0002F2C1E4|nr:hypothetical protein [Myxococcus stipitatus]